MLKRVILLNKRGAEQVYLIRQLPHDKPVKIGSKLFGCKVVRIEETGF